jgi:hypothetical protein
MAFMTANVKLKSAIEAAHFSQETLARKIQEAGYKYGYPNGCNRETIHRWLDGAQPQPQPHHVLLLRQPWANKPRTLASRTRRTGWTASR